MAETEQTKVCPLCAETIKAAAKVCPYCRKSQRRWVFMTVYDFATILSGLITIGAVFLFISLLDSKRDFSLDRDKIRVLEVHFAPEKDGSITNMAAFGIVTNESEHSWSIEDFEIRYLDRNGKLLGMDHASDGFIILPKKDHVFHFDLDLTGFVPDYNKCEARVISANDPRAAFQLFGD